MVILWLDEDQFWCPIWYAFEYRISTAPEIVNYSKSESNDWKNQTKELLKYVAKLKRGKFNIFWTKYAVNFF